jgi:hypothetical protein
MRVVPHLHSRFHHRIWANIAVHHYFAFHFHVTGTVVITHLFKLCQYSKWSVIHEMDLIWTGVKSCNLFLADVSFLITWNFPLHRALFMKMFVRNKTLHCWRYEVICSHYMLIRQCTKTCTVGNIIHSNETASITSGSMWCMDVNIFFCNRRKERIHTFHLDTLCTCPLSINIMLLFRFWYKYKSVIMSHLDYTVL